jgi:hypothetical protein
LEALVIDVLRRHLQANGSDPKPISETDRELIERHLLRVTLSANEMKVHLRAAVAGSDPAIGNDDPIVAGNAEATIAIPWTVSTATLVKGLAYVPAHNTPMKPGSREVLLMAIAKARKWIKDIERGQSFVDIARREGKAERHVRHLAPLAIVSPRIITAIIDGTVPAGLTTMALAKRMPYSWTEQEQPQRLEFALGRKALSMPGLDMPAAEPEREPRRPRCRCRPSPGSPGLIAPPPLRFRRGPCRGPRRMPCRSPVAVLTLVGKG